MTDSVRGPKLVRAYNRELDTVEDAVCILLSVRYSVAKELAWSFTTLALSSPVRAAQLPLAKLHSDASTHNSIS